jgi:predicted signal transduction protein with EAL and GGDEF domain
MRAAAVAANLVQMVIVLFVFVLQGIAMDGRTILALFILFIIACFNLLVLLFTDQKDQGSMVDDNKTIIKRLDFRVGYTSGTQPKLIIGDQHYDLIDVSEGGAKIAIGRHERLKKRSRCRVNLLCGEKFKTKAAVIRREGNEAALAFQSPVAYRVLLKEKQVVEGPAQEVKKG